MNTFFSPKMIWEIINSGWKLHVSEGGVGGGEEMQSFTIRQCMNSRAH